MPCFCVFFFLHLIVSSWHRVKAHLFLARFNLFSVNVIHEQQTTTGCCCCDCCCTTQQKSTVHGRNENSQEKLFQSKSADDETINMQNNNYFDETKCVVICQQNKKMERKTRMLHWNDYTQNDNSKKTIITIITMTNWYCNISVNECGCLWPRKARVRIQRAVNTIAWIDQVNKFKGSVSIQNNKLKWWQRNEERKGEKKRTPKRCHRWSTLANNSIKMYFHLLYV